MHSTVGFDGCTAAACECKPVIWQLKLVLLLPAGDRHQDRKFKEWLTQCHATLDKSVAFEVLADAAVQVCAAYAKPCESNLLMPGNACLMADAQV